MASSSAGIYNVIVISSSSDEDLSLVSPVKVFTPTKRYVNLNRLRLLEVNTLVLLESQDLLRVIVMKKLECKYLRAELHFGGHFPPPLIESPPDENHS